MASYAMARKVLNRGGLVVIDAFLVAVGFILAYWFRWFLDLPDGVRRLVDVMPGGEVPQLVAPLRAYWWIILDSALFWPLILDFRRFYDHPASVSWKRAAWISFQAAAIMLAGILATLFLFRVPWVNRTYILIAVVSVSGLIFLRHLLSLTVSRAVVKVGGAAGYPVLIVTTRAAAADLVQWLHAHPEEYSIPVGLVLLDDVAGATPQSVGGIPVCGQVSDLARVMHDLSVSAVIIGSAGITFDAVRQIVMVCETEGVDAWLLADFVQTKTAKAVTGLFAGREALLFTTSPGAAWQRAAKRIMDVIISFVAIVLFLPVMLVIAVLIRLTSPGAVLFRQKRSGLHGKPFTMLKFRSMETDAEMRKAELDAFNEMEGPVFKITNDPRITTIGRVLRRWSLDELPQLFNVLAGHMSLVGPRPLPVYEVEKMNDLSHRRRLSMKPGLTCLWQVRGRNKVRDFKEWVRLDLEYIDNWSLGLDLRILIETPVAVLKGTGC
ncbi:MAG TPA: sugar transferase [Kiritimatiellia bacterium]|nr:sugar transferase [Kiritimatiellia bacterium]